jgi:hypothetical protein
MVVSSNICTLITLLRFLSGTSPKTVANLCVEKGLTGNLYLITDGQVSQNDVEQTERALGNHQFASVKAFLLETGSAINLSVTAPFTR